MDTMLEKVVLLLAINIFPLIWTIQLSFTNYRANRLVCEAADRAMQIHGGIGYSRHEPFEHIYRHHRRYRITEGAEEIQMRKVAAFLFGYLGPRRQEFKELDWSDVDYRNSQIRPRSGATARDSVF